MYRSTTAGDGGDGTIELEENTIGLDASISGCDYSTSKTVIGDHFSTS